MPAAGTSLQVNTDQTWLVMSGATPFTADPG